MKASGPVCTAPVWVICGARLSAEFEYPMSSPIESTTCSIPALPTSSGRKRPMLTTAVARSTPKATSRLTVTRPGREEDVRVVQRRLVPLCIDQRPAPDRRHACERVSRQARDEGAVGGLAGHSHVTRDLRLHRPVDRGERAGRQAADGGAVGERIVGEELLAATGVVGGDVRGDRRQRRGVEPAVEVRRRRRRRGRCGAGGGVPIEGQPVHGRLGHHLEVDDVVGARLPVVRVQRATHCSPIVP